MIDYKGASLYSVYEGVVRSSVAISTSKQASPIGLCRATESTALTSLTDTLANAISIPVVKTQTCTQSPCGGHYFYPDYYDCPPACAGLAVDIRTKRTFMGIGKGK